MYQYNNLDDFVAYGKTLTISYQNLSLTEIFNDIKFPMFNIIQDYIEELKDEAITIAKSLSIINTEITKQFNSLANNFLTNHIFLLLICSTFHLHAFCFFQFGISEKSS